MTEEESKKVSELYQKAREADKNQDYKLACEYYSQILEYRSDWIAEEYLKKHDESNMDKFDAQPDSDNSSRNKYNKKPTLSGVLKKTAIVAILLLIILAFSECGGSSSRSSSNSYDDYMAGQNWGKGYYYNRNSHSVEKNVWGMLH